MRLVPEGDGSAFLSQLREQARHDARTLVPRPGHPIFGLAAPGLRPVTIAQSSVVNGEWTLIRLAYGDAGSGSCARVTTTAADGAGLVSSGAMPHPTAPGDGVLRELREAIDDLEHATARQPGSVRAGDQVTEPVLERLPAGEALLLRRGPVWAARLLTDDAADGAVAVTVTVAGGNLAPRDVRLEALPGLRPVIEAQLADLERRIEQRRRPSPEPPPVELEPAEGVAALRALADFLLATWADTRTRQARQRGQRLAANWGPRYRALWQRAADEYLRLSGAGPSTADEAVTEAVNHLGHLAENAPWFSVDADLREAAIDETLRRAMLGDPVPSEPAQLAWSRYWKARLADGGRPREPAASLAEESTRLTLGSEWQAAWQAWTRQA
jgi:hypothetical protein